MNFIGTLQKAQCWRQDARLPCGLRVLIVDEAFEVETAINALRDSMVDRVRKIHVLVQGPAGFRV